MWIGESGFSTQSKRGVSGCGILLGSCDLEKHRRNDDNAFDNLLGICGYTFQVHDVPDEGHNEGTDNCLDHVALAAGQARTADDASRYGIQLAALA